MEANLLDVIRVEERLSERLVLQASRHLIDDGKSVAVGLAGVAGLPLGVAEVAHGGVRLPELGRVADLLRNL